ncbi:MAG TPA: outer membrane beta-barrel protein [Puia sp.]|jgi:hypothetical protein
MLTIFCRNTFLLAAGLFFTLSSFAQTDTTGTSRTDTTKAARTDSTEASRSTSQKQGADQQDTLRVGNLLIVRNGSQDHREHGLHIRHHYSGYQPRNISTNWGILDLGFANYNDRTNYASLSAQQFAPGAAKDWFKLRTGKSVDVNIWIFMQRINLIKHVVNFKYGLGIELNNYRYEEDIRFRTNPTKVIMDTIHYSKNKLAADYVTVPFLLNFNFTPHRRQDFGFSGGVSVGYKYSSREKFKSSATGKEKTYDDFDMETFKISYIAELQLGWLKLYGSYATRSMFSKGLDQVPYTLGVRFGNW